MITLGLRRIRRLARDPVGVLRRIRDRRGSLHQHVVADQTQEPIDLPRDHQHEYDAWLALNEPGRARLDSMRAEVATWEPRLLVSVIMPVFNASSKWLDEAIRSVREQVYDNWELCIADDASTHDDVRDVLEGHAALDSRIRVTFRQQNGGISAASNTALAIARGELVGFLDHDDTLRPQAIYAAVRRYRADPGLGLVYSDEDKIGPDGALCLPTFKPDWSPDWMLTVNYVCHFTVIRRELVSKVGGFRSEFDGSQDYDLFLRVIDTGCGIGHIPEVLYSWRMSEGSAAQSTNAKPYAYTAGRRALSESLSRRGHRGRVELSRHPGWYHVRYEVMDTPSVAVVVVDGCAALAVGDAPVAKSALAEWADCSVVVVTSEKHADEFAWREIDGRGQVVTASAPSLATMVNEGVRATSSEYVLIVDGAIEVRTPGWIAAMLERSQLDDVGAVGCRISYPDGTVWHEGIAIGYRGSVAAPINSGNWLGLSESFRDVSAVSAQCLMVRRRVFDEVGGFDATLVTEHADVDFCLRLRGHGYRNVLTPLVRAVRHAEDSVSASRPRPDEVGFQARWGAIATLQDPFINPAILSLGPLRLRLTHRA
jgi:GT2 family glycosyltransferase